MQEEFSVPFKIMSRLGLSDCAERALQMSSATAEAFGAATGRAGIAAARRCRARRTGGRCGDGPAAGDGMAAGWSFALAFSRVASLSSSSSWKERGSARAVRRCSNRVARQGSHPHH